MKKSNSKKPTNFPLIENTKSNNSYRQQINISNLNSQNNNVYNLSNNINLMLKITRILIMDLNYILMVNNQIWILIMIQIVKI